MEKITDDELLNFLDGSGNEVERENVNKLISSNVELKKRVEELQAVHTFLQKQSKIENPSKNFTEKVMSGLHAQPSFTFLSPRNGLLLLIGLMVASGLAMMMVSAGSFDQWNTFFNLDQIPLKNNWVKLPTSIPVDVKQVVKIFVMINIIIGFILLDRTILRPIFQKRAERFS
ncbi:MAG TPA: hypothetical protein VGQ59_20805 [Cyclobacteriaceae bacterium]|jgi:hypothetical protein|nr:hypothetical protein [Cyclobacteriaceae bacterium]